MKNTSKYDLASGSILRKLIPLSLPAIAGQLAQMAYNFADMVWLGRLSGGAVAAVGSVGPLIWLSLTLGIFGQRGAEIGIAQNLGRRDGEAARRFLNAALITALTLGIVCGAIFLSFRHQLIGFYKIIDPKVERDAVSYLYITALAMPLTYINSVLSAAFSAGGNSVKPFVINLICLALNALLDPLLIFNAGLGVIGAAIATASCQATSCIIMLAAMKLYKHKYLSGIKLWRLPSREHLSKILRWGAPGAFEIFFFTFFVMVISRLVAAFGSDAMVVQRIGNQADQFSYMVSGGFGTALTAFIGQNYGAGKRGRIRRGVMLSMAIMSCWGIAATVNLLLFNRALFRLFVPDEPNIIEMGASYLRIFALCQLAASLEGVGGSVFRGYGRTVIPSAISVSTNVLRIILAWVLSQGSLRQDGIWWALSISAFLRGGATVLFSLPLIFGRREVFEKPSGENRLYRKFFKRMASCKMKQTSSRTNPDPQN
ncbi:MAG: MATE family efflux transporter [Oscillospiraceae bacterium]|jgi:putative MATE family efflux protein|nr:MATE family efflux transporter [Oscillospiraceae bacterium]